jgi:hypothetical protein
VNVSNWPKGLIGRTFESYGRSYQLLDLGPGSDSYTILFCPKGYRIPKWALWDEKKAATRDGDDLEFDS